MKDTTVSTGTHQKCKLLFSIVNSLLKQQAASEGLYAATE